MYFGWTKTSVMKGSAAYLIGIVFTIVVGAVLQYFYCCDTTLTQQVKIAESISDGRPFEVIDASKNFSITIDDNFNFPFSSYEYITPISSEVEQGINKLREYLQEQPETSLLIMGMGYKSESNYSAFPTLGEARANSVKSAMVERGLAVNQLSVEGSVLEESWQGQDSIIYGPVLFSLSHTDANREVSTSNGIHQEVQVSPAANFSEFVLSLKENPMVLYFETGSAFVHLTETERNIISTLNQYIDQNSAARIVIHGHTDNSGSPVINDRLALERAQFLKAYLVRNGFQSGRIEAVSHGESTPVASNQSPEGRAKNRRAVLTIEN